MVHKAREYVTKKGKEKRKPKAVKYPLPKEGVIVCKPKWKKPCGKSYPIESEEIVS